MLVYIFKTQGLLSSNCNKMQKESLCYITKSKKEKISTHLWFIKW